MTAFFKDLGKKISDVAQDASKKTSDLIEITKINSSINTERNTIAETQKKIGAAVYSLHTAGETLPDVLAADLQLISEKLQNITSMENKIAEIKAEADTAKSEPAPAAAQAGPAPEAEAAAETEESAPETEAPAETAKSAPASRFCTNCGSPVEAGMIFCGNCGQKVG